MNISPATLNGLYRSCPAYQYKFEVSSPRRASTCSVLDSSVQIEGYVFEILEDAKRAALLNGRCFESGRPTCAAVLGRPRINGCDSAMTS